MSIAPTAVISPDAEIGSNVEIGSYSIIGPHVRIGDGCSIDAHVKIAPYTSIGPRCLIYYGALVGEEPQDHRFKKGLVSYTEIGSDSIVREYVTIHRPPFEGKKTRIGSNVMLMGFVHVAHDVQIGDRVTIANHTAISGHVEIGEAAVLSGYILIHQFCRIGRLSMIGARTIIVQDIPPFCLLSDGNCVYGPNTIGLKRAGMNVEQRSAIRKTVKYYFFSGLNGHNALEKIENEIKNPAAAEFVNFVRASRRGIMPGNPKYSSLHDED